MMSSTKPIRKASQTDYRKRGDAVSVVKKTQEEEGGQESEPFWKMEEPACCTPALMNTAHQVVYEISTSAFRRRYSQPV
jgi:hypothetical protein